MVTTKKISGICSPAPRSTASPYAWCTWVCYILSNATRNLFSGPSPKLQKDGKLDAARVQIELRASGYESSYEPMIRAEGIENLVHLLPPLPYRDALENSATADGLLLFQAACCDHQIPAKVFEYLRLGKPILALTSDTGDTAALLRQTGGATIADSADWQAIYRELPGFLKATETHTHPQPDPSLIEQYSRKAQAQELASLLNEVVRPSTSSP
jgi:hypothetical protein